MDTTDLFGFFWFMAKLGIFQFIKNLPMLLIIGAFLYWGVPFILRRIIGWHYDRRQQK